MKNAVRAKFRAVVRSKPLGIACAMMMIHVSSTELSLGGIADRVIQFVIAYAILCLSFRSNAGLSIPGGEPGYAPGDCSAFIVRDLTGDLPDQPCNTREQAEKWVQYLTEWHPRSRPIIEQNAQGDSLPPRKENHGH